MNYKFIYIPCHYWMRTFSNAKSIGSCQIIIVDGFSVCIGWPLLAISIVFVFNIIIIVFIVWPDFSVFQFSPLINECCIKLKNRTTIKLKSDDEGRGQKRENQTEFLWPLKLWSNWAIKRHHTDDLTFCTFVYAQYICVNSTVLVIVWP